LSSARNIIAAMANSGIAGYVGGGNNGVRVATVDKFAFPADTASTLGTGLSGVRDSLGAMANEGVFDV
jgi:hypothetical protein